MQREYHGGASPGPFNPTSLMSDQAQDVQEQTQGVGLQEEHQVEV